jgi:hypothetical protein
MLQSSREQQLRYAKQNVVLEWLHFFGSLLFLPCSPDMHARQLLLVHLNEHIRKKEKAEKKKIATTLLCWCFHRYYYD